MENSMEECVENTSVKLESSSFDESQSQNLRTSKDKIPIAVEVCLRSSSTASPEDIRITVQRMLQKRSLTYSNGPITIPSDEPFLLENVDTICVCGTDEMGDSHEVLLFWQVTPVVYVYQLNEEGPGEEMGQEDSISVFQEWFLPAKEFKGLWESLIFDSCLKRRLLRYAESALLFSEKGVDPSLISWNRVVLLHGPPGTGKTSLCKALAQKLSIRLNARYSQSQLVEINAHSLFSKWFSESGKLIREVVDNCERITKFIYGHGILRSLFLRHSKGKEFSRPGATRFATHFLSLRSLLDARVPLGFRFISEEWTRNDDFLRLRISTEGVDVASLVKESHYPFWSTVEEVVKVTRLFQKIYEMLEDENSLIFVLIDEVESLAAARQAAVSGSEPSDSIRVVNALLTQLDRLKALDNVVVLTTSNITAAIDIAFVDRADIKAYVGPPTVQARYEILRSCLQELLRTRIISPPLGVQDIQTVSFARIQQLINTAALENSETSLCISKHLLEAATISEGFSGRTLRKLPFLAHASLLHCTSCDVSKFISALIDTAKIVVSEKVL